MISGLGGEIRSLSYSDKGTVANAVIKRLKASKSGIAIGTSASVILNMILEGRRPIEIHLLK